MDRAGAVRVRDLAVVDLGQPVVRGDRAGVRKDQTADRIRDRRVLLDAPVVDLQIVVHEVLVVEHRGIDVADLLALFAVENVRLCDVRIAGLGQNLFDAVLNLFNRDAAVLDLAFEIGRDVQREQLDHARMILLFGCFKRLGDGRRDLLNRKIRDLTVSFDNLVHKNPPHRLSVIHFWSHGCFPASTEHGNCTAREKKCQYLVVIVNKSYNMLYLFTAYTGSGIRRGKQRKA